MEVEGIPFLAEITAGSGNPLSLLANGITDIDIHFLQITTGGGLFAEGPGHSAKAQKPSAKALPSAALGKEPSEKKINSKEALCRGPFVGHSANPFPSANGGTQQRKAAVNDAAPLTAPLPSADS